MVIMDQMNLQKVMSPVAKRVLVVVTAGGYTNAAPVLEIAAILASRGYVVDFATLEGRQEWLAKWPFINRSHIVGPAVPPDLEESKYKAMSEWPTNIASNWAVIFETRKFLESSWPEVYQNLSAILQDAETRPSFILADYWVDAARDLSITYDIPLAMHWPQMPTAMLPATYIPGIPGLQIDIVTSEFASVSQRIRNAVAGYISLPHYLRYLAWQKRLRARAGVFQSLPRRSKPEYLCLVNSFFGLEAAKDIPPNVSAIGPVLSDNVSRLSEPYTTFLSGKSRVLYISFGTHVILPQHTLNEVLCGVAAALGAGLIDGIIWPIRSMARGSFQQDKLVDMPIHSGVSSKLPVIRNDILITSMSISSLLANQHPLILFVDHAPQRCLLHDTRIVVFLTHAGPASTNEALYAGVPMITLPFYFDQLQNALRLRDAGVSIPLCKEDVSAKDIESAIVRILDDRDRTAAITVNLRRLQNIAQITSRRKYLAADLIEETLVDWEGRRLERSLSSDARTRGWHLQTADMRMSWWRASNWDIIAPTCVVVLSVMASIIAVACKLTARKRMTI